MRQLLFALTIVGFMSVLDSGAALADTIEVQGTIAKKVDSKREIYVYDGEQKHEYYFNDTTKVYESGQETSFISLKEGQKVKVTANKIGKRLDPIKVEILQ